MSAKELEKSKAEIATFLRKADSTDTLLWEDAVFMAEALLAAGYRRTDHIEYAADHKRSDLEFQDEDGNLWTDEDDFRDYFEEYGNCTLVQRHVTAWEPLHD